MAEMDAFERRVAAALLAYADEMPTRVDAAAITERVAAGRAHRWTAGRGNAPRLGWVLVGALLLLAALLAVGLLTGTWRLDLAPRTPLQPGAVQMLPTADAAYDQVVVDGRGGYWATGMGRLVRFAPGSEVRTAWSIGDDPAFGGLIAGPAAQGGVWVWSPREGCRRFDGGGFRETIVPAGDVATVSASVWRAPPQSLLQVTPDGTPWWSSPVRYWDGDGWAELPGQPPLDPGGSRQVAVGPGGPSDVWVADAYFGWGPAVVSHFDGDRWTSTRLEGAARVVLALPAHGPPRAATSDGRFLRFDAGAWVDDPGPGFAVWDLAADATGGIWAVSDATEETPSPVLARFDGTSWTTVVPGDGPANAATGRLSLTPAGPFLPTSLGLMRVDGAAWARAWPDASPGPRSLAVIAPVSQDEAWVADEELWHFGAGRWESQPIPVEVVPAGTVAAWVGRGPDGTTWVSGDGGIAGLREGEWRVVAPVGGSHSIGIDPAGLVWASGVADDRVAVVSPDPAVPVRFIECALGASMAVGGDGSVHVSGDTGLGRVTGDGCTWLDVQGDGRPYATNGVIAGPAGRLLASIGDTTQLFDGTSWTVVDSQPFGTGSNPAYVFEGDGSLWRLPLDTTGRGSLLERFDGADWVSIDPGHAWAALRAIRSGPPGWLWITPDGALWFGGASGVGRIPAGG